MKYLKKDVLLQMREVYNTIKEHPYRATFEIKDIASYKRALHNLSDIWGNLLYCCEDVTEEEKYRYKKFSKWSHNYRAELRLDIKDNFPMDLYEYYDNMLEVTRVFLDTGNMDEYYAIECLISDGNHIRRFERFKWITKEMCGIDSSILPCYLCVSRKYCVDDTVMKDYIFKEKYLTEEKKEEVFNSWVKDDKPVLIWVNENLTRV